MKADRDSFIIVMTFVPIAVGLLLFLLWKATGNGPFDLPNWALNGPNLPNLRVEDVPGVVGLVNMVQGSSQTIKSLAIGIGVGLVGGIVAVGILLDLTRGMRRARSAGADGSQNSGQ